MSYNIYYLEGPDSSGKTTLAKSLTEKYNARYIHCSWSPDIENYGIMKYLNMKLLKALDYSMYSPVVLDRLVISAIFYAEVYRQDLTNESKAMANNLLSIISKSKKIIPILCLLDFDDWKKTYTKSLEIKQEMYEMSTSLEKIYYKYLHLSEGYYNTDYPDLKLDYKIHNFVKNPIVL